jgi:hypothetical protein
MAIVFDGPRRRWFGARVGLRHRDIGRHRDLDRRRLGRFLKSRSFLDRDRLLQDRRLQIKCDALQRML